MRDQLIQFRKLMKENNFDAYMIPTTDYHGSEYVNPYFMCRKFISGFTGSEGTLVITQKEAYLWTDGRYFLQGEEQLKNSGIGLMKMGQPGVPTVIEFLKNNLDETQTFAFDGLVVSSADGLEMEKSLTCRIISDVDLVDKLWKKRPKINPTKIYSLPASSTGKTSEEKLLDIRNEMEKNKVDYILVTNLEEIAWFLNLRGSDVECTPVFFSFALISKSNVTVYLYKDALDKTLVPDWVTVKEYMDIENDLKFLPQGKTVWASSSQVNYRFFKLINKKMNIISSSDPLELMKALKNNGEIKSTRKAHIRDGVAVTKFIYWLKNSINTTDISEISAADKLLELRKNQEDFLDSSFPTIAGYAYHGAIVHYNATEESDISLKRENFLLLDSGAHYIDGTTDITRTISLGALTEKMKKYYTAVLASHITLATSKFKPGTKGIDLDRAVRKPLLAMGLDYNHGSGHGVGHILSVHEWPNNISPRSGGSPILPSMITSNEPGVYIEGEFGIRLENEILCYKKEDGYFAFETITFCPFDKKAVNFDQLSKAHQDWLRFYSKKVYEVISPFLTPSEAEWLYEETRY